MQVRNQNIEDIYNDEITQRLMNIKDPEVLRQERLAYQKRKYGELLQKISFLDSHLSAHERRYDYPDDFKPFVFFFKFLAKRPDTDTSTSNLHRLRLWLPDTILTSDGDNPAMWLYSSADGYVHRTDNFTAKNITNKLGSFSSPDELVAVLKKPQAREFSYIGNDIRLLTMKDLSLISQSLVSNKGDMICLQKYIKSIGPKAFICRTCWRRDRNPYVWVVTNTKDYFADDSNIPENQRYITNPKVMNSCTIVNSIRGRYVDETAPYVANLVKYVEYNLPGVRFEEFVGDFVKDESETWWLINIRGFVLVDKLNIQPRLFLQGPDEIDLPEKTKKKKVDGYQKVLMCKYCEQQYPAEELLHKMTLRSIIQTDRHLMHRGKNFKWLARSDIKQIDTGALYQEFKVCNTCYKLHEETEKLRDIEFEFAKILGVPINPERKPDMASAMNFNGQSFEPSDLQNLEANVNSSSAFQLKKRPLDENGSPKHGNSKKGDHNSMSSARANDDPQYMKRYRMMLYLHMLYDVPKDIDATKNYSIEYTILGQKQKYKIDLSSAFSISGDILIPINKLRVFFLFSKDRKGVNDYINEQKVLTLNLYCDNERMGTVNFELNDFLSDNVIKREMFKVFSGKKLPILSWGLKVTVGLTEGGLEDVNRVKLSEHKNIYLTHPDYYTCEALPEEWLQVFEETHKHFRNLLDKSDMKNSKYSIMNGSMNGSFRKSSGHNKVSMLRSSILRTHTQSALPVDRNRLDSPDQIIDNTSSPSRSLFNDEKSISEDKNDVKSVDESMEVVRKILVDSIKDYEKGDKRFMKKPEKKRIIDASADKNKKKRAQSGVKPSTTTESHSALTPMKTWGSSIKVNKVQSDVGNF